MKNWFILLMLLVSIAAKAQLPTDFRSEQIYLNPERHVYAPGDTISLEGKVACLSENELRPYSNYLYVELFDERDSVLVRQKLSCKDCGFFSAKLVTEYEWPAGIYYVRAYTRFMQNFSLESFPVQPLLLGKSFPEREETVYETKCAIVPAGGSLAAGYPQMVVVQLTDDRGFPIQDALYLTDTSGDTLSTIRTSSSGMAQLRFIPQADVRYALCRKIAGRTYRYPLPASTADTKVQGSLNGKRLNYEILYGKGDLSQYQLYLYDRKNGLSELASVKEHGIVMLENAPSVLSLFLVEGKKVVSEYTVATRYRLADVLKAPETLAVGDTLTYQLETSSSDARVMVRVVPEEDRLATYAEGALNYLSDYGSALAFPASFYACSEVQRGNDLQAWLSAAKFKRFQLLETVEKDTAVYVNYPEQVLEFRGKVEKKNGRPMKGGSLLAYRSDGLVYDAPLNEEGHFRMAVDDYEEGEEFFLQALTEKGKPDFATYLPADESYPPVVNTRPYRLPKPQFAASETVVGTSDVSTYMEGDIRNYVFPDITVKARLYAEEIKSTNEFYQTNFANREKIEERNFQTLYDILVDMPGITVVKKQPYDDQDKYSSEMDLTPQWIIQSNRGPSVLSATNNNLPIIVDNTRFTDDQLDFALQMPAFEIERVEFLRPWQTNAYINGAVNGAILVITRDCKDRSPLPSKGAMYQPVGLVPSPAFIEKAWVAPAKGIYRLIVDVFTSSGVQSYEHWFEVTE